MKVFLSPIHSFKNIATLKNREFKVFYTLFTIVLYINIPVILTLTIIFVFIGNSFLIQHVTANILILSVSMTA